MGWEGRRERQLRIFFSPPCGSRGLTCSEPRKKVADQLVDQLILTHLLVWNRLVSEPHYLLLQRAIRTTEVMKAKLASVRLIGGEVGKLSFSLQAARRGMRSAECVGVGGKEWIGVREGWWRKGLNHGMSDLKKP